MWGNVCIASMIHSILLTPPIIENLNRSSPSGCIACDSPVSNTEHTAFALKSSEVQSIGRPSNIKSIALPVQNASFGLWKSSLIAEAISGNIPARSTFTPNPIETNTGWRVVTISSPVSPSLNWGWNCHVFVTVNSNVSSSLSSVVSCLIMYSLWEIRQY